MTPKQPAPAPAAGEEEAPRTPPPAPEGMVEDAPADDDDTAWATEAGARDDAHNPALARAKERLAALARDAKQK
jgi:hypothetical protein